MGWKRHQGLLRIQVLLVEWWLIICNVLAATLGFGQLAPLEYDVQFGRRADAHHQATRQSPGHQWAGLAPLVLVLVLVGVDFQERGHLYVHNT